MRKGWAGGAEPDPGGRLLLVFGAASVPPASRCQRRSSFLPQFASERGYRPRPEEPPGPKQQFVPKRVKREAQHPHSLGNTAIVTSIGKECPLLHPPLICDNSRSPGTCIKMDWCFGRKGRKHPPSQSYGSGNLAPRKNETKESAHSAPHLHPTPASVLGCKVTPPLVAHLNLTITFKRHCSSTLNTDHGSRTQLHQVFTNMAPIHSSPGPSKCLKRATYGHCF